MSKSLIRALQFLLFFGVGATILYLIYRKQNTAYVAECGIKGIPEEECDLLVKLWSDLLSVDLFWLLAMLLLFMLTNVSRSLRWLMLTRAIGIHGRFANAFWTVMLGFFANLGLPRMGEVIRAATFARYENAPVEKVIGTVAAGRAVDVICWMVVIALAFLLQFDVIFDYVREAAEFNLNAGVLAIGLGSVAALGVVIWFTLGRRIATNRLFQKLKKLALGFVEGFKSIRYVDNVPLFLLYTFLIWFFYLLMPFICFQAFAPTAHLGMLAALVVLTFGTLGIVFPSPGGMGTYHATVMAALFLYDINSNDAFSYVNILYFSVQLFCNITFGLAALVILPVINKKKLS